MRCDKMHATISVRQCLANQEKLAGSNWLNQRGPYYPGCKGCETGTLARRGKLNDDDLRALLDGYHNRMNPPADVVTRVETGNRKLETGEMLKGEPMEATPGQQQTKECTKCKKPKPIERFSRLKKGDEKRRNVCMDCVAAYQRDRKARIWAEKERMKSEQLKSEPQNIEQETAEPQKDKAAAVPVAAPEKQVEPSPARESTAPTCLQAEDGILQADHGQEAHATNSNQLLLDFSCYPEVLNEIKRIAHHEERPPEVQARFMLKRLLQGDPAASPLHLFTVLPSDRIEASCG